MADIGMRIRRARKLAKLTQAQLGEKAGLHAVTINRIEKGAQGVAEETLERIASALNVSPEDLSLRDVVDFPGAAVLPVLDRSGLSMALSVTEEERAWLVSLPIDTWPENGVSPDAIALMLLSRRHAAN